MTDEAKALVDRLRWSHWYYEDAGENTSYTSEAPLEAADLIETQAREIERLTLTVRKLQGNQAALEAEIAALAGDSHDQ